MPVRRLWIGIPASGFCGESKCAVFLFFQMGMLLDLPLATLFVPKTICQKCNELKIFFEINFVGFLLRSKNSSYLCIVVSKVLSDVIYCKSNPKAYCLR